MKTEKNISMPFNNKNKFAYFALGRNAIYSACLSLDLKSGDTVLTPAFDCDSSLSPFRVLNLNIKYYKSDPYTFEADINNIKLNITPDVKLLHIINHFGIPQNWDALSELRRTTGIPIIEDNAWSFYSKYKGKDLGSFGDFSIFSLYKVLPIIHGGLLVINNKKFKLINHNNNQKWFYSTDKKKIISLILNNIGLGKVGRYIKKLFTRDVHFITPLYSDDPGYPELENRDKILYEFSCDYLRPISKIATLQLTKYTSEEYKVIAKKTKRIYKVIVQKLINLSQIKVLWKNIPKDVVPTCVLILVHKNRDKVFSRLKAKGYSVFCWPTFSGDVIDKIDVFPEIEIIGKKIIQIAIPHNKIFNKKSDSYFNSLTKEIIKSVKIFNPK